MYHYTYIIHNSETQQFYIGVRSSEVPPQEDPYMGSSRVLSALLRKEPASWTKYVIAEFETRNAALYNEYELTEPAVLQTKECLNMCRGGWGWREVGVKFSEEHCRKLSAFQKGKPKPATFVHWSKGPNAAEIRRKIGDGHRNPSDETRRRNSAASSKPCTLDGIKIYPSVGALVAELGSGKTGSRSPNLRFL
jgi:hypothetical protein